MFAFKGIPYEQAPCCIMFNQLTNSKEFPVKYINSRLLKNFDPLTANENFYDGTLDIKNV